MNRCRCTACMRTTDHLRPIFDSDLFTENQNDCMNMNLLTVLSFTREAV